MRELAQRASPGGLGCTQVSEILYTEGVELVGPLPARFELSTVYSGAVATHAVRADLRTDHIVVAIARKLGGAIAPGVEVAGRLVMR